MEALKLPESDTHFRSLYDAGHTRPMRFQWDTRRRTVVDIGAHVGSVTAWFRGRFDRIVAFEPQPDNFACLGENCAYAERHQVALADFNGRGALTNPAPENSGAWELVDGDDVDVRTLDSFGIDDVAIIKIDVQGAEPAVLRGAAETIRRWKPTLIVEIVMNGVVSKETVLELGRLGYHVGFLYGRDGVFRTDFKVVCNGDY